MLGSEGWDVHTWSIPQQSNPRLLLTAARWGFARRRGLRMFLGTADAAWRERGAADAQIVRRGAIHIAFVVRPSDLQRSVRNETSRDF